MSENGSSSDDEFDELFSFNTATAATPTKNNPVSTSPIDFDMSEQEVAVTPTQNASNPSDTSASAHTSETSSYIKVSPTNTDPTSAAEEKNLEDDVFGDLNLDAVKTNKHDEDDFHAIDADTREFLDFLDEPSKVATEAVTSASDILDVELDDDSDDGIMDFVDIDVTSNEQPKEKHDEKTLDTDAVPPLVVQPEASPATNTAAVTSKQTAAREFVDTPIERKPSAAAKETGDDVHTRPDSPISMASSPSASPNRTTIILPKPSSPKRETSTSSTNPYQTNSILESTDSADISENSGKEESEDEFGFAANLEPKVKALLVFDTLSEAIHSKDSSMNEIRPLLYPRPTEMSRVENGDRPCLWSKAICSRTLSDVQSSSLADSFATWDETFDLALLNSGDACYGFKETFVQRLLGEVEGLAKRVVSSDSVDYDIMDAKRNLCSLLVYYYRSNPLTGKEESREVNATEKLELDDSLVLEEDVEENVPMELEATENLANDNTSETKPEGQAVEWNSLIGPIATTLLASGITPAVASVMMSRIIPSSMPLISLTQSERIQGVKTLHRKLYYLICYHLPLLVLHLDRCAPGWYWPHSIDDVYNELEGSGPENATKNGRKLERRGIIPITWFSSHLAGEDATQALEINRLMSLWDVLLTSNDQSLTFFFALSILERNSDSLLMLKGQELLDELKSVMSLNRNDNEVESFLGDSTYAKLSKEQKDIMMWTNHALSLRETTPYSVIESLMKAEDEAVNDVYTKRSKIAMEQMAARLDAEAEAHRRAVEKEHVRKLEERMHKYYKDRLEKFYKKHCPEKVDTVDKILGIYKDQYQSLDHKLHEKYGRGFLPLISVFSPKVTSQTGKLLSNVNQGIEIKKKNIIAARAGERAKLYAEQMGEAKKMHQVAITVAANEIMPIVCGGKKIAKISKGTREALKYYLVDSRTDGSLKVQGAFPTAARLSPEELMDPESIQEKVDMFESLRGAIHIVVMGEGFSAFPSLYDRPLDKNEKKLFDSDESRTNMCALFFIKKGFPFVSVLDGGFAAAHAWLARDGGAENLSISEALVDYDEDSSLFADLERSYQEQKEFKSAGARKKTTLAMQKLLDNSMTRLTIAENRIEDFTDRFISARKETKEKLVNVEKKEISSKNTEENKEELKSGEIDETTEMKSIKSAFAVMRNKVTQQKNVGEVAENSKTFDLDKISWGRDKKEENKQSKKFDFKNISFGRAGRNPFAKQSKRDDVALEKEIDASLSPKKEEKKISTSIQQMTNETSSNAVPMFKDAFSKLKSKKFGVAKTNAVDESSGALREEEAILFGEDD